jgi:hypothetical protein
MDEQVYELLLQDFKPKVMLCRPRHIPRKARFPVVDAHNHLFKETKPEEMIEEMDRVGVRVFITPPGYRLFYRSVYQPLSRQIQMFYNVRFLMLPGRCAHP